MGPCWSKAPQTYPEAIHAALGTGVPCCCPGTMPLMGLLHQNGVNRTRSIFAPTQHEVKTSPTDVVADYIQNAPPNLVSGQVMAFEIAATGAQTFAGAIGGSVSGIAKLHLQSLYNKSINCTLTLNGVNSKAVTEKYLTETLETLVPNKSGTSQITLRRKLSEEYNFRYIVSKVYYVKEMVFKSAKIVAMEALASGNVTETFVEPLDASVSGTYNDTHETKLEFKEDDCNRMVLAVELYRLNHGFFTSDGPMIYCMAGPMTVNEFYRVNEFITNPEDFSPSEIEINRTIATTRNDRLFTSGNRARKASTAVTKASEALNHGEMEALTTRDFVVIAWASQTKAIRLDETNEKEKLFLTSIVGTRDWHTDNEVQASFEENILPTLNGKSEHDSDAVSPTADLVRWAENVKELQMPCSGRLLGFLQVMM